MAARLSRPVRDRILAMHEDGERFKDIALALSISPATVAKYCKAADLDHDVTTAPAKEYSEEDVLRLRLLAPTVTSGPCPSCHESMVTLKTMVEGLCPHCGCGWTRRKQEPPAGQGAGGSRHDHPLSGRPPGRRRIPGRGYR